MVIWVCVCVCVWGTVCVLERKKKEREKTTRWTCVSVSAWDCKNVRARAVDMVMTCMTLEKDVVIVSHPSPWGHWLVQSCKGRTAQKLSICTLPHGETFPYRVSTATLASSTCTHGPPRKCSAGAQMPTFFSFLFFMVIYSHGSIQEL